MGFGPRSSPATLPNWMSFGRVARRDGGTAFDLAAAESACTRSLNKDVAAAAPNARRLAIIAILDLYGCLGRADYVFARDYTCAVQTEPRCGSDMDAKATKLANARPHEHAPVEPASKIS